MSSNTATNSNGIGVLGLLGVVFVTLKLTGFIDWSWWYVTMPFWGGIVLVVAILAVYFIYGAIRGWHLEKIGNSFMQRRIPLAARAALGWLSRYPAALLDPDWPGNAQSLIN